MESDEDQEGHWLTPDRLGGDIANPQSLNRYAYALNNPTTLTDPSGLDPGDPLCGNLYDWPGGSYEGSAPPTEDCELNSYPFIPPSFPIIGGIIVGGRGGSAAPPGPGAPPAIGGGVSGLPSGVGFSPGAAAGTVEQTAPFWIQVIVEACADNPICVLAAGVDPEVAAGVAGIGLAAWEIAKLVPHIHYAHRKGARPSTKGKHQAGTSRQVKDRGGEKGDLRRRPPRKRPTGWKGPWPPPTAIVPES